MSIVLGIGDPLTLANGERWYSGQVEECDHLPSELKIGFRNSTTTTTPPVPQGWQCPVCGRVYAPSQIMCPHSDEHAAAYLKVQLEVNELRRMVKEAAE